MIWHTGILSWLLHASVGGTFVLVAGLLAVHWCRQPIRRIRLIELTLLGALVVPCASHVSWLPHWSVGWLTMPTLPAAEPISVKTTSVAVQSDPSTIRSP
jgi:hypothetical protein